MSEDILEEFTGSFIFYPTGTDEVESRQVTLGLDNAILILPEAEEGVIGMSVESSGMGPEDLADTFENLAALLRQAIAEQGDGASDAGETQ